MESTVLNPAQARSPFFTTAIIVWACLFVVCLFVFQMRKLPASFGVLNGFSRVFGALSKTFGARCVSNFSIF